MFFFERKTCCYVKQGQITGNLISSLILKPELISQGNSTMEGNFSIDFSEVENSASSNFEHCGVKYCPSTDIKSSSVALKPQLSSVRAYVIKTRLPRNLLVLCVVFILRFIFFAVY